MLAAVVSDTHGQTQSILARLKKYPLDALFFLGDFYADGEKIWEELNLEIPLFAVAGNGDAASHPNQPTENKIFFQGKTFFLAHGHSYQVKKGLDRILQKGDQLQTDVVLFGHTHIPFLGKNPRGMWILNPGSAAFPRGIDDASFALIEWGKSGFNIMILEIDSGVLIASSLDGWSATGGALTAG